MKSRFRILGVLLTMIAVPAWGAALYKCLNVDGIPSYVSKRVAGATCTVVVNHVHRVPSSAVAVPAAVPVSGAVKDAVVSAPSVGGVAVMSAPVRPAVAGGGGAFGQWAGLFLYSGWGASLQQLRSEANGQCAWVAHDFL